MITQEQLQELLTYSANGRDVISVYLEVANSQEGIDTLKRQVKSMLRDLAVEQTAEAAAIERYLNFSFDWRANGLALFSGQAGEFFRAYPTAVAFRNRARAASRPYVKPLAHLLDFYAHYGVILVDQGGARFFEYHLGELQSSDGFIGEEVQKLKQGGGSAAAGIRGESGADRQEAEAIRRNLRQAAEAAVLFFQEKSIRRLFLGGISGTLSEFQDLLPKQLRSCLAGTFAIDMNAGEHEVRRLSLQLLQAANAEREKHLVNQLMETAAKGGTAVLGLDDTLQAVSDKRVQTLIISDGYRAAGYVEEEAGYVVANLAKSPLSLDLLTAVDDVVDVAFAFTLSNGGHVEVIRDNAQLENAGRIGAILRY